MPCHKFFEMFNHFSNIQIHCQSIIILEMAGISLNVSEWGQWPHVSPSDVGPGLGGGRLALAQAHTGSPGHEQVGVKRCHYEARQCAPHQPAYPVHTDIINNCCQDSKNKADCITPSCAMPGLASGWCLLLVSLCLMSGNFPPGPAVGPQPSPAPGS